MHPSHDESCNPAHHACVESIHPLTGELTLCYHSVELAEHSRRAGEIERRARLHNAQTVRVWIEDGQGDPLRYDYVGSETRGGAAASSVSRFQTVPVKRESA